MPNEFSYRPENDKPQGEVRNERNLDSKLDYDLSQERFTDKRPEPFDKERAFADAKEVLPERYHGHLENAENIRVRSADEVNNELGYDHEPYTSGTKVVEFKTGRDIEAKTVHGISDTGDAKIGRFFSADDNVEPQRPLKEAEKLALPNIGREPLHPGERPDNVAVDKEYVSYGVIKEGSTVRFGEVNPYQGVREKGDGQTPFVRNAHGDYVRSDGTAVPSGIPKEHQIEIVDQDHRQRFERRSTRALPDEHYH